MAKCEICKKRWLFSKTVKCDCHKKPIITHTHQGLSNLTSNGPVWVGYGPADTRYPQRDPDPHLQYYSSIAIQNIEAKSDNCSEDRYRSQYHQDTSSYSNHSGQSSSDSSGWSSGSSDSRSCDSGSSSSSWD